MMLEQLQTDYAALGQRVQQLENANVTIESLQADYAALTLRVDALENQPQPSSRIRPEDMELIGGWRVNQPYCRGGLAIDFDSMIAYIGGHAQSNEVYPHAMPELGVGQDHLQWPILQVGSAIAQFWEEEYAGGLEFRDGVLWVSPRVKYDTSPGPLTVSGKNIQTGEIVHHVTNLSQPGFGGGFISGKPEMLLGWGGYESGQGSRSGPSVATWDGQPLLNPANHGTMVWEEREKRPPNYRSGKTLNGVYVVEDSWVGLNPRNGEGRWCADKVFDGGVWTNRGVLFFVQIGTNDIDYTLQNSSFSKTLETWLYTYDPVTYSDVQFSFFSGNTVIGNDAGPDGLVYVLRAGVWKKSVYISNPVIEVYRIN